MLCSCWLMLLFFCASAFFFFNDTATTEIYTLSLHDALPISRPVLRTANVPGSSLPQETLARCRDARDRKSTRLNSSHQIISYAVFCLKKKKNSPAHPEPSSQAGPPPSLDSSAAP